MDNGPLFEAIKTGDAEAIRQLLGEDPGRASARNADGVSAILLARYYGRPEIAALLEASGVDLDLFEAAAGGRLDRVRALVDADQALVGACAPDGFNALGLAAFFGRRDIVAFLLDRGADVNGVSRNATGYTALTAATTRGDIEVVNLLLARGANARYRYGSGNTPLHTAAANGHLEVARALVAHGADVRARTDEGVTPREMAVARKQEVVAAWLASVEG